MKKTGIFNLLIIVLAYDNDNVAVKNSFVLLSCLFTATMHSCLVHRSKILANEQDLSDLWVEQN